MSWLKCLASLTATTLVIFILNIKFGSAPPLGEFFDPFHGFWQNAETGPRVSENLVLPGLKARVRVLFDDRQVPHIFAENDADLYYTQGYITARDRLWQMEFQTHAAAGRLSEIVGERALEYDRYQRQIGMVYGAKNTLELLKKDPEIFAVIQSYAAGVNAFIKTLAPKDYPVEYKILDYAPEQWTPFKNVLLQKMMAWDLSARSNDFRMTNNLARFGSEIVADLFPDYPGTMDPIIPKRTPWKFTPLTAQQPGSDFKATVTSNIPPFEPDPNNGSNNWVVSGEKTRSGYPILANDPHLALKLPSVWYEVQLISPNVNVYGVSLPGAAEVIVGFNENVAWGVTNGGTDVMDWYEIKFKDSNKNEYWYDGKWQSTTKIVEEIKIRDKEAILESVIYTHHGPVALFNRDVKSEQMPTHALRWLGHDAGNEARAFHALNRAANYDDYVEASSFYDCPAQNFVFADSSDIAIRHNGKFPLKWQGQGKFVSDGSEPLYNWQGWVPRGQSPASKNPGRSFLSSANQIPADKTYPYYLGSHFAPFYRGTRINEWLESSDRLMPDDFRVLQIDTKNLHAESALPFLLKFIENAPLSEEETGVHRILADWDYFNDADKIAPSMFKEWWGILFKAIWDDEFKPDEFAVKLPSRPRTVQLMLESRDAKWFDNIETPEVETLAGLVVSSYKNAVAKLYDKFGKPDSSWEWANYKGTEVAHLAKLPGFSSGKLPVGGDRRIVMATGKTHGPSWRMVVSLEPQVKAWGIYPGGQSGNPGSLHYDDFMDDWVEGELAELLFLKPGDGPNNRLVSELTLRPEK